LEVKSLETYLKGNHNIIETTRRVLKDVNNAQPSSLLAELIDHLGPKESLGVLFEENKQLLYDLEQSNQDN
jgi:hypothetical protein